MELASSNGTKDRSELDNAESKLADAIAKVGENLSFFRRLLMSSLSPGTSPLVPCTFSVLANDSICVPNSAWFNGW